MNVENNKTARYASVKTTYDFKREKPVIPSRESRTIYVPENKRNVPINAINDLNLVPDWI